MLVNINFKEVLKMSTALSKKHEGRFWASLPDRKDKINLANLIILDVSFLDPHTNLS